MTKSHRPNRPILSVAIRPRTDSDLLGLIQALEDLVQEDQTLQTNAELIGGQIIIGGASDLHLESVCERIAHEYKIQIDVGEPRVTYLETIRKQAEGEGKYIRQTGGSGNYGHCKLRVEPSEAGREYEFINVLNGGLVPDKYISSIDAGVREAAEQGILAGYALTGIKVTLFDGSYHEVDSNEVAFKFAGSIAFKEAAKKASPILLEPVMTVYVTVLEQFMGAIIGEINSRRGRIVGIEHDGISQVIHAEVPLAEMLGYGKQNWSLAQGRAHHTMRLARYEPAPHRGEFGGDEPNVTANKPWRPSGRSGSATVRPFSEPD
jgi:elongation factor G